MSTQVSLRCRCGNVRGVATDVSHASINRVVCYCADCQAFARFLELDGIVNAAGGTDIVQIAPARVRITDGASSLRSMRLSSKGLVRWYADCCRAPVGNTVSGRVPFIGLFRSLMDIDDGSRDAVLGNPRGHIFARAATGAVPAEAHTTVSPWMLARMARLFVGWWMIGKGKPSPFFDARTGEPRVSPRVLSVADRDALRPAASIRA